MEHVLGGVRAIVSDDEARSEVVDIDVRPWIAGVTTSIVQVTVQGAEPDQYPQKDRVMGGERPPETSKRDEHYEYESDRRGEHRYPPKEGDADERPSQRERDELKKKLERS